MTTIVKCILLFSFSNFFNINAYKKKKTKKKKEKKEKVGGWGEVRSIFDENAGIGGKGGWYLFVEPIIDGQKTVVKKKKYFIFCQKKNVATTQLLNLSTAL